MGRLRDLRYGPVVGASELRRPRRWRVRAVTVAGIGALVLGTLNPALAGAGGQRAIGDVAVFASAPAPGHPFGIAVDDDRIYVSTSAGDFFAAGPPELGRRAGLCLRRRREPASGPPSSTPRRIRTWACSGSRSTATAGRNHKLYVADMNGRILRLGTGKHAAEPELFSQVPASSGLAGDWMLSMWNDLVFDKAGNLYVPDDKPRIWRVGPDGIASIWFTDPRLTGFFGFAGGPLGGRIDPTGRWLYVSITVSLDHPLASLIYRVRLVDHPTAADLELVHAFPFDPAAAAPPQATGLAFAKSGNLYVSLIGPNQIAVLDPAGNEIRRISSPLFHSPWGLAFSGKSLLVTNGDLEPADNPAAWKIFKVYVGETGLPLNRPKR